MGVDRTESLGAMASNGPVMPASDDGWVQNITGVIIGSEIPKLLQKTCPGATLPTTNPTWTTLALNPGLRAKTLATNRLSYGTSL
jgi:hypothetical protein